MAKQIVITLEQFEDILFNPELKIVERNTRSGRIRMKKLICADTGNVLAIKKFTVTRGEAHVKYVRLEH